MSTVKKVAYMVVGGIGALMLVGLVGFAAVSVTRAASPTANAGVAVAEPLVASPVAGGMMDGALHPGGPNGVGDPGAQDEALAAALGVTVEKLQAAYTSAWTAAVGQAVAAGDLTQEQADALLSSGRVPHHGLRGSNVDLDALLADALGITVEKLDAARAEVRSAALADAVAAGTITQEQADLIAARDAVRPYVEEAMTAAYADALANAVKDGVITQAQADQLQAEGMRGPGGPGFGGAHHGGGPRPADDAATSGTNG